MKYRFWKHKVKHWTFTVKEWECCGHIWQLLLSKRYPERFNWMPVCPTCGEGNETDNNKHTSRYFG